MKQKSKFFAALAIAAVFCYGMMGLLFGLVWSDLTHGEQVFVRRLLTARIELLILFATMLLAFLAIFLNWVVKSYVSTIRKLDEAVQIVLNANPGHSIELDDGPSELRDLAASLNVFRSRYQSLQNEVEERIREAKADTEEEKNRLAALMSELAQSVLVCNLEGRILLYNSRAKQLLGHANGGGQAGATTFVGLGRSIFGLLERNLIVHALENINHRLKQEKVEPVAHFVTATKSGQLLRVQMAPVLDAQQEITGYVLTMDNITKTVEQSNRRDLLLQSLTEGTRGSLANMRAAVETLLEYPEMDNAQQARFIHVISEEAEKLSAHLDRTVGEYSDSLKMQWPLEDMMGSDLLSAVQRRLENKLGVVTRTETGPGHPAWLKVDSYSVVQALTCLTAKLKDNYGVREVGFRLEQAGRMAHLDMTWKGAQVDVDTVRAWESQPLVLETGEGVPMTLHDVAERHGGEVWCQTSQKDGAYCRLLLPVTQPETGWNVPVSTESRPEYYDFDLFRTLPENAALDDRLLSELAYTVFDTETTGLDPSGGDEIISIGAVRIVNGKLLPHECFDQLIDPKRKMSQASIRITGITPEMLAGQPVIDAVLPSFYHFAEDTVLVAHNAAFDMRFLQLKEDKTGVRFTQPVLDTLLLSAVAHPNQGEHKLEAIAERLGVNIIGRHTSLGDAIVTGEIFLRLIPLLAKQGVRTLREAREAAKKTYYARIEY